MKSALVLIDLQNDYLAAPGLQPHAKTLIARAANLLSVWRKLKLPIIHVRTSVTRNPDTRMPHWRQKGRWMCEIGTPGHAFPPALDPQPGETTVDKQFFSGFSMPGMDEAIKAAGCDSIVLVGVHLHACIRATALDAYARGYEVFVAEQACGSDDPLHAAITRRYLRDRAIQFISFPGTGTQLYRRILGQDPSSAGDGTSASRVITHFPPVPKGRISWSAEVDSDETLDEKATRLHDRWSEHRPAAPATRARILRRVAKALVEQETQFARHICADVGKPITQAHAEVRRTADLLRITAALEKQPTTRRTSRTATAACRPLGVIAAITPWNNPLAIAVGKIAPAYFYDNAVLWKPAPAATMIAWRFYDLWHACGGDMLEVIAGDASVAAAAARHPRVAGITVTGSEGAGVALQEIAAARHVPFQAELGGNNAAILWEDADLPSACAQIAAGAFGFAGQRCTANRRVIVPAKLFEGCPAQLVAATRKLVWGNPSRKTTQIGPVISPVKASELMYLCRRAADDGLGVIQPLGQNLSKGSPNRESYFPPTIIVCPDPAHEIVQEESFGPILVVQPADNFDHAMQLLNGVRQGLVAALFSNDKAFQDRFLRDAQAGILKINQATADADAVSPFGGWRASGVGPAEHGIADREFFTRWQTIYVA